ncbi:MAG: hypothetical protein EOO43_11505 [Flavobacterium sp.]|nr:MAG: hypothetical protein EOO43_11505 [Flavobacterium sp.]
MPTFKQSLLRLLGKICTFKQFYDHKGFSETIFEIVTLNYNEKNTNTLIKNSWVLANLCANREACENFKLEINQELLFMSLAYCLSNKEKLTSNGFRALGYFITNNSDEVLCQLATMESPKTQKIVEGLKEVYLRPFANSSVKVTFLNGISCFLMSIIGMLECVCVTFEYSQIFQARIYDQIL